LVSHQERRSNTSDLTRSVFQQRFTVLPVWSVLAPSLLRLSYLRGTLPGWNRRAGW